MSFYEFKTTEGRVCCSTDDPQALCKNCRAAFDASPYYNPPDSYALALKRQADPAAEHMGRFLASVAAGAPDGYALALAKRADQEKR